MFRSVETKALLGNVFQLKVEGLGRLGREQSPRESVSCWRLKRFRYIAGTYEPRHYHCWSPGKVTKLELWLVKNLNFATSKV